MNVKEIRRINLKKLAEEAGGIGKLAAFLNKSPSFLSQTCGINARKNIGNKFASQIEAAFNKPIGWLDDLYKANIYSKTAKEIYLTQSLAENIPLIQWRDIEDFSKGKMVAKYSFVLPIKTPGLHFSKYAFALKIHSSAMESIQGINFSQGAIIIVEPEDRLKNDAFVIVSINKLQKPELYQYKYETNTVKYFKPFNSKFPMIKYNNNCTIYGIVRLMLHEFK